MKNLIKIFASVFGLGYMPFAPGTWGTLGALVLWYFLLRTMSLGMFVLLVGIIIVFSCYISSLASRIYGKRDDPRIVIDEVCGFLVSMIGTGGEAPGIIYWGILGFILFRVFDISKPPPIRFFERLPGGLGVVADDIMAGVYVAIILNFLGLFLSFAAIK